MTGLLKDLMHERADELADFRPDLDAILSAGGRQVRRRRTAMAAAAGTMLAVTAVSLPAVVDRIGGDDGGRAASTSGLAPTWAEGSTIHSGDRSIEVGHQVHAFVTTDLGYVIEDPSRAVWSWVDGRATRVGQMRDGFRQKLVADGHYAGWLDVTSGTWRFVVLDQATGRTVTTPVHASAEVRSSDDNYDLQLEYLRNRTGMHDLDGTTAYALDERGLLAIDAVTGSVEVLGAAVDERVIDDVVDGTLLVSSSAHDGLEDQRTYLTDDLARLGEPLGVDGGKLSPDLHYVMSENGARTSDDFTLIDLRTGDLHNPAVKGEYDFFAGYEWLDADTYAAMGFEGDSGGGSYEITILTCSASAGTCTTIPGPRDWRDFELPIGEHIGD